MNKISVYIILAFIIFLTVFAVVIMRQAAVQKVPKEVISIKEEARVQEEISPQIPEGGIAGAVSGDRILNSGRTFNGDRILNMDMTKLCELKIRKRYHAPGIEDCWNSATTEQRADYIERLDADIEKYSKSIKSNPKDDEARSLLFCCQQKKEDIMDLLSRDGYNPKDEAHPRDF